MAFKGTQGEIAVARDGGKFWTGIMSMKIVAINPTKAQLNALGIGVEEEPVYLSDKEDEKTNQKYKSLRLSIWLEGLTPDKTTVIRNPVTFFIENRHHITQKGTYQYINNFGQTAIGTETEPPSFTWFKSNGVRKAYVGEDLLVNFLINWLNGGRDSEMSFDNFLALVNGNLTELRGLYEVYRMNTLRAMLIVTEKNGKYYQNIFSKYFSRWNITSFGKWKDYFDKNEYNVPKGIWSFELQEYIVPIAEPDADPSQGSSEEQPTGTPPATSKWG